MKDGSSGSTTRVPNFGWKDGETHVFREFWPLEVPLSPDQEDIPQEYPRILDRASTHMLITPFSGRQQEGNERK